MSRCLSVWYLAPSRKHARVESKPDTRHQTPAPQTPRHAFHHRPIDGPDGGGTSADRRGAGSVQRFFGRLPWPIAGGHPLQPVGPRQAVAADSGVICGRGLRFDFRGGHSRGMCGRNDSHLFARFTTICRRWTTTTCGGAGPPVTRRLARRWRFWPAMRYWHWHSKCWPARFIRRWPPRAVVRLWPRPPGPPRWWVVRPTIWRWNLPAGDVSTLENIHRRKTGAMFFASLKLAGYVANADAAQQAHWSSSAAKSAWPFKSPTICSIFTGTKRNLANGSAKIQNTVN